jgi:NAD(P)-dependent dehydrogenase (short-subunit alcohol dehydrogenase family)
MPVGEIGHGHIVLGATGGSGRAVVRELSARGARDTIRETLRLVHKMT